MTACVLSYNGGHNGGSDMCLSFSYVWTFVVMTVSFLVTNSICIYKLGHPTNHMLLIQHLKYEQQCFILNIVFWGKSSWFKKTHSSTESMQHIFFIGSMDVTSQVTFPSEKNVSQNDFVRCPQYIGLIGHEIHCKVCSISLAFIQL